FEIFVSRINFEFVINWDKSDTDDNHCQGQSEVKLYETHSVVIGLARCRKKRNGTSLSCHHRNPDHILRRFIVAEYILFYIFTSSCFYTSVNYYKRESYNKYDPINGLHLAENYS